MDPNRQNGHNIELDNVDHLEDTHCVMRIKIRRKGQLVSHPGCLRSITSFVLEEKTSCAGMSLNLIVRKTRKIIKKSTTKAKQNSPKQLQGLVENILNPLEKKLSKIGTDQKIQKLI